MSMATYWWLTGDTGFGKLYPNAGCARKAED
jgi:hypothetical protein